MPSQNFVYGTPQKLKKNTFAKEDYTFAYWNTKADGTGTTYEDEQEVENLTLVSGDVITLYAIYAREIYINNSDIVFDGTKKFDGKSYIDTGIYLFNEKNINRDFEISFEIKERVSTGNKETMVSAINEIGNPFQGFVFRMSKDVDKQYELEANAKDSKETLNFYDLDAVHNVIIKRTDNILYINIDNAGDTQIIDYSTLNKPFYYPLTLGAGLDGSFNVRRYFKGTLSDIEVELYE